MKLIKTLFQIKTVIDGFEDSNGIFYTLSDLTEEQETELKSSEGFMDNSNQHLTSVNVYQQWPLGRGVFVSNDNAMIIHINAEDHLKFTAIQFDKDLGIA